ncbi:MAG TPA: hypothetical protein VGM81_14685 [Burkholderiaceae bacterium]|jgi:hypothetical protein
MNDTDFIRAYRSGQIAPPDFTHLAHIRAAVLLLQAEPFLEACIAMRDGLKQLAAQVGRPAAYHETITVAFMAVILEHMQDNSLGWQALLDAHPELCDRELLPRRYYPRALLQSELARRQFVLAPKAEVLP